MPAAATRPVVRLLTRRAGVRRPLADITNDRAILEVAEVFRVDVVSQLFEGREPVLRVRYLITQTPQPELQEEYPLELEEAQTTTVAPQPHPAERWARALYRAIFEGRADDWIDLDAGYRAGPEGDLQQTLAQYGCLESTAWDRMSPEQFFTFWTMNCYNAGLQRYSDEENLVEERNLLIQTVEQLLKTDPQEVLALGPLIDDFVQVMLVLAWTLNKESAHPLL